MEKTDLEKSLNSNLLEEVFSEIEKLENSSEFDSSKPAGFLEDVFLAETDAVLNVKKKKREKKTKIKVHKNGTEKSENSVDILQELDNIIHEGVTDSSDDEENKYFEERKYSDCGKTLKDLIKQKTVTTEPTNVKETPKEDKLDKWNSSQSAKEMLKKQLEKLKGKDTFSAKPDKTNLLVDPVLGMRIVNPLVSSTSLKEKMIGRVSISTANLKKFIATQDSKNTDWVTGGAIVSKMNRTSQKGNQYCIWNISDLTGDIKTVCVLLFGSAYKEHWKTSVGTVVGILNPAVMDGNGKSEATIRVDNAHKIMIMGNSKDYGLCKSKKKNGENCMSVVNTAKCDFCVYHMKKEYNKACRRPDLQPPKIGRNLDNLKSKMLGKGPVCFGGKIFNFNPGKKSSHAIEKDEQRMKSLNKRVTGGLNQQQTTKDKDILSRLNGTGTQPKGSTGMPETQRNRDIMSRLNERAESPGSVSFGTPKPNALDRLNEEPRTPGTPSLLCVMNKQSPVNIPKLLSPQDAMVDLDFTISKKDRKNAKANALKYIRTYGPIKKVEEKSKKTPEQISSLKRKLQEEEDSRERKKAKESQENSTKKNSIISEKFKQLMNSETKNKEMLKMAETEEREKYFNKLEVREKIEEKMASTFKVECKAVRCLKCNYKSFSASELCKKEKHPLKVVNAVKRFWKCGNCSNRTVCLELVPLHSCKNCGSSKWERGSMMAEKKGPNLSREPLSIRGHEEKYIGANVINANLNLLVPEEGS